MWRYVGGLLFSVLATCAWGQTAQPAPMAAEHAAGATVSVSGVSNVRLSPDRVVFTVGVESRGATVSEATKGNNEKMTQVIDALKKAGVSDSEIKTSNFSVSPQQDFKEGRTPRVVGYHVNNRITVTRDDLNNAGELLQTAINAGGNQASNLNFSVSDRARGRDQGLQLAFEDARAKAQVLAQAAKRTLGRAIVIVEGSLPNVPVPILMQESMTGARSASTVPIEQGSEEVRFTLSVTFELL